MVGGETLIVNSSLLWMMLPLTLLYLEGVVGPLESKQLARILAKNFKPMRHACPNGFRAGNRLKARPAS